MQIEHKKNTAYYLSFPMIDSATPASFKTGLTPADAAYYKDGAGVWTSLAITDTAAEIGSTGMYEIDLTASEMNHDQILIKFTGSGAADTAFMFDMRTKLVADLQDLTAAQVNAECDTAITDAALATASALSTAQSNITDILADTADMQPKLGSPAGASVSADIAAIKSNTADILVDTAVIGIGGAGLTALATASALSTAQGNITDILADTAELQGDWVNGGRLDLLIDAIKAITDALPNAGALTSLATASALATVGNNVLTVDTVVDGIQADLSNATDGLGALKIIIDAIQTDLSNGTDGLGALKALIDALPSVASILTTQMTESYAANGVAPTLAQALFAIHQHLMDFSIASTTRTVKKLDSSTTAFAETLDSATTPTSLTR